MFCFSATCLFIYVAFRVVVRYDTRCYFNVRSKADMSQLNLPHGNRQLKSIKAEKLRSKRRNLLTSNSKSLGNHAVSPEKEKEKLR